MRFKIFEFLCTPAYMWMHIVAELMDVSFEHDLEDVTEE